VRFSVRLASPSLALLALLAPAAAGGQTSPRPIAPIDQVYARSLALSAFRGLPAGNDGIFYNAAALAARKAFTVEGGWLGLRAGDGFETRYWGASVVDSTTSSVAGGFAWSWVDALGYRTSGLNGGLTALALAFPLAQGFFLGATVDYMRLNSAAGDVNAVNVSPAMFWQIARLFSIGVAGYNLINTYHPTLSPRGMGVGIGIGDERLARVGADWYRSWGEGTTRDIWSAGGEVFLFDVAALRGGWEHDTQLGTNAWSAGAGFFVNPIGADVGYRQWFGSTAYRVLAATLKFAVPGM
jgi:hypothetical protein